MKKVENMTRCEILNALVEDGFEINPLDAAETARIIQQAARAGALLWSNKKIVSTLSNRPLVLKKVV